MSGLRRGVDFLRRVKRAAYDTTLPMPNPPDYIPTPRVTFWQFLTKFTLRQHYTNFARASQAYKDSWKDTMTFRDQQQQQWAARGQVLRSRLDEEKEALKDMAATAEPMAKEEIKKWIGVYKASTSAFVQGFQRGRKGEPLDEPTLADTAITETPNAEPATSSPSSSASSSTATTSSAPSPAMPPAPSSDTTHANTFSIASAPAQAPTTRASTAPTEIGNTMVLPESNTNKSTRT